MLNIINYRLELENNSVKARVGIYINESLSYVRRTDLESQDKHLINHQLPVQLLSLLLTVVCLMPQIKARPKRIAGLRQVLRHITAHRVLTQEAIPEEGAQKKNKTSGKCGDI